jgi:hypothetical protein
LSSCLIVHRFEGKIMNVLEFELRSKLLHYMQCLFQPNYAEGHPQFSL